MGYFSEGTRKFEPIENVNKSSPHFTRNNWFEWMYVGMSVDEKWLMVENEEQEQTSEL